MATEHQQGEKKKSLKNEQSMSEPKKILNGVPEKETVGHKNIWINNAKLSKSDKNYKPK